MEEMRMARKEVQRHFRYCLSMDLHGRRSAVRVEPPIKISYRISPFRHLSVHAELCLRCWANAIFGAPSIRTNRRSESPILFSRPHSSTSPSPAADLNPNVLHFPLLLRALYVPLPATFSSSPSPPAQRRTGATNGAPIRAPWTDFQPKTLPSCRLQPRGSTIFSPRHHRHHTPSAPPASVVMA